MNELKDAEELLALRRMAMEDIKIYESRLLRMSKEYKLDIDLCNDKVSYCGIQ